MVLAFTARYFINKTNYTEIVAKVKMVEKPIVLPDGTKVYLNAGASLIYPKKFGTATRRIELSGEAFFNVTRNEKIPFVINTKQAQIKVLGTSFNVIAEKCSDNIQVVVESGLVELKSPLNEEKILISKGNTGSFLTGANKYQLSSSDVNSLAWMTNRIQFKESGLLYVTQTLERLFKKKINLGNENLKKCKISADFKNQSLEKILDAIKESLKVEIKSTKKGYVLTGSGC
jgi:ferric-dicitrate binding protein FerR (iron transport regulator)